MTVLFALAAAFACFVALVMVLEIIIRTYQAAAALSRLAILLAGAVLATVAYLLDQMANAATAAAKAILDFARRKAP